MPRGIIYFLFFCFIRLDYIYIYWWLRLSLRIACEFWRRLYRRITCLAPFLTGPPYEFAFFHFRLWMWGSRSHALFVGSTFGSGRQRMPRRIHALWPWVPTLSFCGPKYRDCRHGPFVFSYPRSTHPHHLLYHYHYHYRYHAQPKFNVQFYFQMVKKRWTAIKMRTCSPSRYLEENQAENLGWDPSVGKSFKCHKI